jgi:hypothetical protein
MHKKPKIVKVQNGIAIAIEYCCICENGFHSRKPLDDVGLSHEVCPSCSNYVMMESYDPNTDHLYDSRYDSRHDNDERDEYEDLDENFEDFEDWGSF